MSDALESVSLERSVSCLQLRSRRARLYWVFPEFFPRRFLAFQLIRGGFLNAEVSWLRWVRV